MSLTHASTYHRLDEALRDHVRRGGVNPQREVAVVRRMATQLVHEHDQASLTGAVLPLDDREQVIEDLVAGVAGFGVLQKYLDDPEVEEIWINQPSRVFISRHGRHELTPLTLDKAQVVELVERMLKTSGRRLDLTQPFVDALLPGGHRLHVVLEGISRGCNAVNIRKFVVKAAQLEDLERLGTSTPAVTRFLRASVVAGLNILVVGGTQAGKPTTS